MKKIRKVVIDGKEFPVKNVDIKYKQFVLKHNTEVKASFHHWIRMKRWMIEYDGKYFKPYKRDIFWGVFPEYIEKMKKEISDIPFSENCPLCQKYLENKCKGCPLVSCDDSIYSDIINADTKEEWILNAKKLIAKLFSLRWHDESK